MLCTVGIMSLIILDRINSPQTELLLSKRGDSQLSIFSSALKDARAQEASFLDARTQSLSETSALGDSSSASDKAAEDLQKAGTEVASGERLNIWNWVPHVTVPHSNRAISLS